MSTPIFEMPEEPSTERFNRPPRIQRPLPEHAIKLPAPPTPTPAPRRNIVTLLLPGLGMMFSMGLLGWLSYSQTGNLLTLLPTGVMAGVSLLSTLIMYREQIRSHRQSMARQNERFEQIFRLKQEELEELRDKEKELRLYSSPGLEKLAKMVRDDDLRLWERRPEDPDFTAVRLGLGELPPSVVLELPDLDPLAPRYAEVYDYYQEHKTIKDVPLMVNLREVGSLGIWGTVRNRQPVLELVYAMLVHLITLHAPHEVHIALICPKDRVKDWQWLKWVPHVESLRPDLPGLSVGIGPEAARVLLNDLVNTVRSRISSEDQGEEEGPKKGSVPTPHYVLLIDGYNLVKDESAADYLLKSARQLGATVLDIESNARDVPDVCNARLEIPNLGAVSFATTGPHPTIRECTQSEAVDRISAEGAGELARTLTSKHRARSTTTMTNIPTNVRLIDVLFNGKSQQRMSVDEVSVPSSWKEKPAEPWSILLGCKQNGERVWLNLLDKRDGPHGLVAGTTGSGKSVLLQSMILSLALTHSPEEINFVLIDFKGGSTAESFADLPHTISVITNLQGRLVDRSLTILKAEARRRQEVFSAVEVQDITTYHERQAQEGWDPMPRLVIVIDEFAEMAKEMPTFMDEVNSLAAIGRSLGMHLILATQKPAGVVPDKVWANLKFRICLRVADPMDSRDMLGVPDAAFLSSQVPGRGYLRVGSDRMELFQAANVIYPYRPESSLDETEPEIIVRSVGLDTREFKQAKTRAPAATGKTELEVLVQHVIAASAPVERWPDPLPEQLPLGAVWASFPGARNLIWHQMSDDTFAQVGRGTLKERLRVVVGLIDDPFKQLQRPLRLDLQDKHYLIVGSPRTGRSTLLQTVVYALIRSTTPEEVHISVLDFGGQDLFAFEQAPHVANVLSVNKPAHLRRFLSQVNEDLDRRAALAAAGQLHELPDVFYVIDGFGELRTLFPDEVSVFIRVARSGLALKTHLVVASDQALSIPLNMRNSLLGRLALHLSDSAEYFDIVGRVRGALPESLPGRGLLREAPSDPVLEFQVALPVDEERVTADALAMLSDEYLGDHLRLTSAKLTRAWDGATPESIKILPAAVEAQEYAESRESVRADGDDTRTLPQLVIGLGDRNLAWTQIDYTLHGPHFLVFGPPQSGKTNLLHTWVWDLCERYTEEEVRFTLIGLKNQSLNLLKPFPHVQRVVDNEFRLDATLEELAELAEGRTERLRELVEASPDESMVSLAQHLGPVHFVIVDDFDAIRFTRDRQAPLMTFARHGRDTRTFLVLAGASSDLLEFSELLSLLKRGRYAMMLQPGDMEVRALDVRLPASASRQEYPVGRGYLFLGNKKELVQTMHLEDAFLEERLATTASPSDSQVVTTLSE